MGIVRERDQGDEEEPGGSSPWVDLGLRVCPVCRRELMGWEERCPTDGAEGVRKGSVQADGTPPVPAHLLDWPTDADADPDAAPDADPDPDADADPDPDPRHQTRPPTPT